MRIERMDTTIMQVAVTGASGFLGSHLVLLLENSNIRYTSFNRKKHDLDDPNSLRDLVNGQDVVIHLAGVSKNKSAEEIERVNVRGTESLLQAVEAVTSPVLLIFASSFQVYTPHDVFGKSKKMAEELIEKYSKKGKMKAIILRFSNLYGPGCPPFEHSVISTFVETMKNNKQITLFGDGEQKRDYLHVDDAAHALIKAIFYQGKNLETFDICTGRLASLNKVIKIMQEISGKNVDVIYKENGNYIDHAKIHDYQKAKKMLQWEPTISLEDGLRKLIT